VHKIRADTSQERSQLVPSPREYQRHFETSQLPTALLLLESRLRGNDRNAVPFKRTSMRRHSLSRPTWRPRCSDASFPPDAPSPRFHSHSRRSRDADRVHDGVRPLGARRCYLGSGLSVILGGQVRLRTHRPRGDRGPCGTLAPQTAKFGSPASVTLRSSCGRPPSCLALRSLLLMRGRLPVCFGRCKAARRPLR
jgi:hypothetical protein